MHVVAITIHMEGMPLQQKEMTINNWLKILMHHHLYVNEIFMMMEIHFLRQLIISYT